MIFNVYLCICAIFSLKRCTCGKFNYFVFLGFGVPSKNHSKMVTLFQNVWESLILQTLCPPPTLPTGFLNLSQVQVIGADPPKLPNSSTFSPALIFWSPENCRNWGGEPAWHHRGAEVHIQHSHDKWLCIFSLCLNFARHRKVSLCLFL